MSVEGDDGRYLTAPTEAGFLIIHSSPVTLSWVPRDVVNEAYNLGGVVTVGTFDNLDQAKQVASQRYRVAAEDWQVTDALPFDLNATSQTEIHSPEIDGHNFLRHGIRWK
jgi:hypothetical protein